MPIIKEINDEAKGSRENNLRLGQMETLLNRGKLGHPSWNVIVDWASNKFGVDLSSIKSADAQQFEKLSNDFIKNAKQYFGSRLTDADLKAFMKTVPTLSQSDAGKRRIIDNLKIFNDASLIKKDALKFILKENGGKIPVNLDILIDEITSPKLDVLAEKFKNPILYSE